MYFCDSFLITYAMAGKLKIVKDLLGISGPEFRTGLVLSGGGARGFAHAGAIKALNEMGIKPEIIAGVSAGSVAAVMYSAGIEPERMVELFHDCRFSDFCELSVPKDGFFRLDRFKNFLRKHIPYTNLEDLPIPVVVGATNLDEGIKVIFDKGPLPERVAASCSIPIVFKPQKIDGVRYVDGGVLHNLPAWSIRNRCKYLIGINCSPLLKTTVGNGIVDIALRSYELMAKTNVIPDMEMCDIVIRNEEIARYKVFNLKEIEKVFESGYRDTINFLIENGFKRPGASKSDATVEEVTKK